MNFKLPGILFSFLVTAQTVFALAPANDHCSKAYTLRNISNYCSSPRAFTTDGATPSRLENPGCFPSYSSEPDNDVWFKFTAIANTVSISVIGAIEGTPKGTLQFPQFALYQGSCSNGLLPVGCMSDGQGYNIAETFINDLAIGGTYYIRVDGRRGKTGSFQLCVNNFNPVPSPSSDCATAVVLCDKSPFTVPSISGVGYDDREVPPGLCLREESSSAWYKWTCDKPGTLTFILKPVNPADDIDFALFLLPFGVDDCSAKIPVRCMASGEQVNASYSGWARCSGKTGLRSSSADLYENAGCDEGDDNFIATLRMEQGESFALLVNNYHNTGNGFSITFGGSGTFKGPVAHFVVNKLKINQKQELWVRNKSSFVGGINNWEWNFGVDAKPATAKGKGPHKVKYSSIGKKSISLVVETNNGCKVTKVRQVTVTDPPPSELEIIEESVGVKETLEAPESPKGPVSTSINNEEIANVLPTEFQEKEPKPLEIAPKSDIVLDSVTYDVKYTATIYFASDSFSLDGDDLEVLKEVLIHLRQNPDYKAIVEGHTNNIPDNKYCNKLASERAGSVISWLNNNDIHDERIIRKIFGKDKVFVRKDSRYHNPKVYQKAVVKVVQRE